MTRLTIDPVPDRPITLIFNCFPFNLEEWRRILIHCPNDIVLILGANLNHIEPTKILLDARHSGAMQHLASLRIGGSLYNRGCDTTNEFVSSWASASEAPFCPLQELLLTVSCFMVSPARGADSETTMEPLRLLLKSIGNNHRLRTLHLDAQYIHADEWLLLWKVIASHRSLRYVHVTHRLKHSCGDLTTARKAYDVLWSGVRSNPILCELELIDGPEISNNSDNDAAEGDTNLVEVERDRVKESYISEVQHNLQSLLKTPSHPEASATASGL